MKEDIAALRTHLQYLDLLLEGKMVGVPIDPGTPGYSHLTVERKMTQNRLDLFEGIQRFPQGYWAVVEKHRVLPEGSVVWVKYVYRDRPTAVVELPDGCQKTTAQVPCLTVINAPPLPIWIPAPGMKICCEDMDTFDIALSWSAADVRIQTVHGGEFEVERRRVVEIAGRRVVHGSIRGDQDVGEGLEG